MIKKCGRCLLQKSYEEFSKGSSKEGLQSYCKSCKSDWRIDNKSELQVYNREYKSLNKDRVIELKKKWRIKNHDRAYEYHKEYCKRNREQVTGVQREWERKKLESDFLFKMKKRLRGHTWRAFKFMSAKKSKRTEELLGCNIEQFREYIISKFLPGMTEENYGEWHIDHIKPLSSASTLEDLEILCHYSNLQPLWAVDNLKKGARSV